jgi:hypothetical protein
MQGRQEQTNNQNSEIAQSHSSFYKYCSLTFLLVLFMGSFLALGVEFPILFRHGAVLLGAFGMTLLHLANFFIIDRTAKIICLIMGGLASVITLLLVLWNLLNRFF